MLGNWINWREMARKKLTDRDNSLVIPFGKAVRVGNFKLWRGNYVMAGGKDRTSIECVHVSNVDGSWMVRIPSTSQMYSTIMNGYATVEETLRENFLGMLFTNMYNVCAIPSEALHDAFYFLTEMMTFPYLLLPEKEMEKRMKENMKKLGIDKSRAKDHVSKMMEYRKGLYELIERKKSAFIDDYERQQAERMAKEPEAEKQLDSDAIAEQAVDILNEKGED